MTEMNGEDERRFTALYLGYASNLSPVTMKQRCPDSMYVGLARLDDWKWIINETGYANILPSPGDVVYANLFFLSGRDEAALDVSEGVPWMYEKQMLEVTRLHSDGRDVVEDRKVKAVAYVDVKHVKEGKIYIDYVYWVNKAIKDGIRSGIPESYMEKYLRPYTPELTREEEIAMVRTSPIHPTQLPSQIGRLSAQG